MTTSKVDYMMDAKVERSSQLDEKKKEREQACKPNSVPRLTGVAIIPLAPALLPGSSDLPESWPREGVGGAGTPPLLFGLAPSGVYLAPDIAIGAVRSYPAERGRRSDRTFSPLPVLCVAETTESRRYVFCGTFRFAGVRSASRTSPCDPRC